MEGQLGNRDFGNKIDIGGLYTPPPNPSGLCLDTQTVLGLCSDLFGWRSCQIKMSSLSKVLAVRSDSGQTLVGHSDSPTRTVLGQSELLI